MKSIILVLISSFLFSFTTEKATTDLSKENIKGNVSTINESIYHATENSGEILKSTLIEKNIYKYDGKGSIIEVAMFSKSDQSFITKFTLKYDDKGNKIESIMNFPDGVQGGKTTYIYDDRGNQIESVMDLSNKGNFIKNTFEYDDLGNQIAVGTSFSSGFPGTKFVYKYDDKGDKIEWDEVKSDGSLSVKSTYKYENFDKNGNWLKKIEFKNDQSYKITEREIEYY